jgi:hypothetical protein
MDGIEGANTRVGNPSSQHSKGHIRAQGEEQAQEEERSKLGIRAEMRGHGIISQNKEEKKRRWGQMSDGG